MCTNSHNTEIKNKAPSEANTYLWPSPPAPTPHLDQVSWKKWDFEPSPQTQRWSTVTPSSVFRVKARDLPGSLGRGFLVLCKQSNSCHTQPGNPTQHPRIAEANRKDRDKYLCSSSLYPKSVEDSSWTEERGWLGLGVRRGRERRRGWGREREGGKQGEGEPREGKTGRGSEEGGRGIENGRTEAFHPRSIIFVIGHNKPQKLKGLGFCCGATCVDPLRCPAICSAGK